MKLSDYIRGFRKGKEAHRLEKEAMRDPFLADALEGYSRVESGADEQIELLRRRVNMRVTQKRRHTIVWSVAASLLIGVCIGSYFLLQENTLPDEARIGTFVCRKGRKEGGLGGDGEKRFRNYSEGIDNRE